MTDKNTTEPTAPVATTSAATATPLASPARPAFVPYNKRPPREARPVRVIKEDAHKINKRITAKEVRLVGEDVEPGVYSIDKALAIAQELGVDLVEISPNAVPPVCRAIDYKKFLYDQKKKQKEIKNNSQKVSVKEIRFGPTTDDHDFNFKLKHAIGFLQDGEKIRAYVFFKGRSIIYKERGEILLLKFAQALELYGKIEQLPKLEGKKMFLLVSPKK